MIYINEIESQRGNTDFAVFAMGGFGGRMDQTLANIHVLIKYTYDDANDERLYALMDKDSFMVMLKKGRNIIKLCNSIISKKSCGLFPISEKIDHI